MKLKVVLVSLLALFIFVGALGVTFAWMLFQPAGSNTTKTRFIVQKGDSIATISEKLQEEGIVRSSLSLRILAKLRDGSTIIQPGTFEVSSSMKPTDVLTTLLSETQDVWVTLPEGWRTEEIAQELSSKLRTFDQQKFIGIAKKNEGKLFPDTYLFSKDSTEEDVLSVLMNTFEKRFEGAQAKANKTSPLLTSNEQITLASLVEREAKTAQDRKIVAGILLNRMQRGMPLQVDATLQYAKAKGGTEGWWPVPKALDKELVTPYNTYKNPGLPPGPICNPGLNALEAALAPTTTDYVYYLTDTQGKMHYAVEYNDHLKNIEMYLK